MLAGFTFYHYWMVGGYALFFVAAHLLLALVAVRCAGMRMASWPLGATAGILLLAVATLVFGNFQRGQLMATLEQNIGKELQGVCQQAGRLITEMGGDASPDDEALRANILRAVRVHFSQAASERFKDARFAPITVVQAGREESWGDLVIEAGDLRKGHEPVYMGCYNQYEHRYSGFTDFTLPYWRFGTESISIPFENIVFFRQDSGSGTPVVSFSPAR